MVAPTQKTCLFTNGNNAGTKGQKREKGRELVKENCLCVCRLEVCVCVCMCARACARGRGGGRQLLRRGGAHPRVLLQPPAGALRGECVCVYVCVCVRWQMGNK